MKTSLLVAMWLLFAVSAPAQTSPPSQTGPTAPVSGQPAAEQPLPAVPDLAQRLAALHPREPLAYFLLAEEVAHEARTPQHKRLASTLYVLAMALQPNAAAADITPSVCLGLADLAGTPDEARWLRAMADSLTRRDRLEPDWSPPGPEASPERAALDLATAIGLIRAGEGLRAKPLFEQPAVQALLKKLDFTLNHSGMSITELRRNMDVWRHCPECYQRGLNQRVISRPNGFILCPTCGGNPGPVLTPNAIIGQLRFESVLLDGVNRSWSAQALVDGGAPLRDLDPAELPGAFGVDPVRAFWRDGQWVPDPDAPPPEPDASQTEAPAEAPLDAAPSPDGPENPPVDPPDDPGEPASNPPIDEPPGEPISSQP